MSNSSDYHKKWMKDHKEQQKQYHKKWEQDHKEQRKQYKRDWRERNQSKSSNDIICPYFINETVMQITCESANLNAQYDIHRFKGKELKDNHRNCFCESFNYKKCPHTRKL